MSRRSSPRPGRSVLIWGALQAGVIAVILSSGLLIPSGCGTPIKRAKPPRAPGIESAASANADALEDLGLTLDTALSLGSTDNDFAYDVAVDADGNVYLVGRFWGTTDFDPGPEIETRASRGKWDGFLAGFDRHGEFKWVRTWGTTERDEAAHIATDTESNVYLFGRFQVAMDFDLGRPEQLVAADGGWGLFLVKFDSKGEGQVSCIWDCRETWEPDGVIEGVCDNSGNLYLTGGFSGSADLDPGTGTNHHISVGEQDTFLIKLGVRTGDSPDFLWARTWGGGKSRGDAIALGEDEGVLVLGHFGERVDFDPTFQSDERTSESDRDIYLSSLDSTGDFRWARTWGCAEGMIAAEDVAANGEGDIFVAGAFSGTVDFAPGPEDETRTSGGTYDAFASRLNQDGEFEWVTTWGGTEWDGVRAIAVSDTGQVSAVGFFQNTVDFEAVGESEGSTGTMGAFLTVLDDGRFEWGRTWGATAGTAHGFGLAADSRGELWIAGTFGGDVRLDGSGKAIQLESNGALDVFVVRLVGTR